LVLTWIILLASPAFPVQQATDTVPGSPGVIADPLAGEVSPGPMRQGAATARPILPHPEPTLKRFELIKQAIPDITRVGEHLAGTIHVMHVKGQLGDEANSRILGTLATPTFMEVPSTASNPTNVSRAAPRPSRSSKQLWRRGFEPGPIRVTNNSPNDP
jgi:hypothetical protein